MSKPGSKPAKLRLPPKGKCRGCPREFHMQRAQGDFSLTISTDASLLCAETGGDVWLGGFALAEHLCEIPAQVAGKRVLELGAGTGYLSLVCAMLGAEKATATDLPLMVDFIQSQVNNNKKLQQDQRLEQVQVLALDWNQPLTAELRAQILPIDLVVATDLLYQIDHVQPIVDLLTEVCSADTVVLVSQSQRYEIEEEKFLSLASERHFKWQDRTPSLSNAKQLRKSDVSIFQLVRLEPSCTEADSSSSSKGSCSSNGSSGGGNGSKDSLFSFEQACAIDSVRSHMHEDLPDLDSILEPTALTLNEMHEVANKLELLAREGKAQSGE